MGQLCFLAARRLKLCAWRNTMAAKIPGYKLYTIDEDGIVVNTETGETVCPTTDSRGKPRVSLKSDTWKINKARLARLVLMAYRPFENPEEYWMASVVHRDNNLKNVSLENLEWTLEQYVPMLIPGLNLSIDDFVTVPGYSKYEINLKGELRHKRQSPVIGHTLIKGGYRIYNIM